MLSVDDILAVRMLFYKRFPHRKMRKQFLLDYLWCNQSSGVVGEESIHFNIGVNKVCRGAWLKCYQVTDRFFNKIMSLHKKS